MSRLYLSCVLLIPFGCAMLGAQTATGPSPAGAAASIQDGNLKGQNVADIERRLNEVTAALGATQKALEKSMQEIQDLRSQLEELRAQTAANRTNAQADTAESDKPTATSDDLRDLRENQDKMQAEIKQLDQIKVETSSKYPLRVTGLVLFNAYANAGVVDNAQLPTLALPRFPGASHGSSGGNLRQTLLGFDASGPRVAGARSTAQVSIDFWGGGTENAYGYSASAGVARLRQSKVSLDWDKTTLEFGYTGPLISPLSPTSLATVAEPSLSGAGNLWVWSPQLRLEQRIPLSEKHLITLEGGFIDPYSPGYASIQLDNPTEASRHPGYEGRIAFRTRTTERPFALGVGAYSANQVYDGGAHVHAWAVAADWQIPISHYLQLSGEAYRGRAIGGLGGGIYKDILSGTDTRTGLPRTVGVDAVGGWSQLKFRFTPTLEANAAFGLDDALSSNFNGLNLSASTNPLENYARNSTFLGNIIYRPKTYLIFSPEYRRMLSWQYTEYVNTANIFTMTVGYQF